eukprot:439318_1
MSCCCGNKYEAVLRRMEDEEGFDDVNMEETYDIQKYEEITNKIQAILSSGEYGGYPLSHMYSNNSNYWCSNDSANDIWLVFDCHNYTLSKIEIKFQMSYAAKIMKIYSSDIKNNYWSGITKKINNTGGAVISNIKIKSNHSRYIKIKFEQWINGYVGVERIRFYQTKGLKLTTKRHMFLVFGYVAQIERNNILYSIIPTAVTSLIHAYCTTISYQNISKHCIMDLHMLSKEINNENLRKMIWRWLSSKHPKMTDLFIKIIFETQTRKGLIALLKSDYVCIQEERIFTHCVNWLKKQYTKQPVSTHLVIDIAGPILPYIRFPLMSMRYLSGKVYDSGLLSDEQFLGIIRAKYMRDAKLTDFNSKIRKRCFAVGVDDDGFDDENIDDIDQDLYKYNDITDSVHVVLNSGEYAGYPASHMYNDSANYWCSNDGANDVWMVFDCEGYEIGKIGIRFQQAYACSIVKVYTSYKRNSKDWRKVTKKINMPKDGRVHFIQVSQVCDRYIKLRFEDWMNGYVGIERIRFYQDKTYESK